MRGTGDAVSTTPFSTPAHIHLSGGGGGWQCCGISGDKMDLMILPCDVYSRVLYVDSSFAYNGLYRYRLMSLNRFGNNNGFLFGLLNSFFFFIRKICKNTQDKNNENTRDMRTVLITALLEKALE